MGCDIHMHVEYKGTVKGETKWLCGDHFIRNPYYGIDDSKKEYKLVPLYTNRDYSLFATLANVRNYSDTQCISNPRGLPGDVTETVKNDSDSWGCDAHSHSYLTLKELIEFQSNIKPLKLSGMISREDCKKLDNDGIAPESWCQWTNNSDYVQRKWEVKNDTLIPIINDLKKRADELGLIYDFIWHINYGEAMKYAENIRIVFWFDN